MSAPYTHTVELAFDSAKCADQIASFVDARYALIITHGEYADIASAAWKATRKTDKYYRVALHDDDTNSIIISLIQ
jgi:23S rRNA A2030 N6-methylase RlmJ